MAIYRVPINVSWAGQGSPGVNIWHVRTTAPVGVDDTDQINAALDAMHTFYGSVSSYCAKNTQWALGDVVNVDDKTTRAGAFSPVQAVLGGNPAPSVLQICVSWRTAIAARRGMGRTFLGPLSTTALDTDGTPTANALSAIQSAANTLITASSGTNGWAIGVWGLQNPAPRGTPPSGYLGLPRVLRDIISARVRDQFAVLRSRR